MSQALAVERGLNFGNSGQSAIGPESRALPGPDVVFFPHLSHPIGNNCNPVELEIEHIYDILATQPDAPRLVLPRDGIEGQTLAEIAGLAWSQEGNVFDLVQTGIIGLFAWEHSPLVLAGEALQLGYLKLKTLERGLSLDEAAELPIAETSPDLFKGLSWLLTAATAASVLPVPANLMAKTSAAGSQKTAEQPENSSAGGQGPEFKIPGWVWTAAGGIGLLGLITACARAFGLPEPGITVATNTPDRPSPTPTEKPGATHTATLAATPTETPFFGAGGPELPGGAPDQIKALLETGMPLPITDCVTVPESGGDQKQWDNWIKTLVENKASQPDIADLESKINDKLIAWGISDSTTLELCGGGDGGWSFVVRDNSSGLFWWSFDLQENRFADRPDRVFDHDWQFKPMPREGLKSGLKVEILMINGWPLAVSVDSAGRPIQYFDPVLQEFINFYPDTPTPTRTASAIPTITNTPRPTAIPATRIPTDIPTSTLEPSPTAQPEGFVSTWGVLPTREELIGCAKGVRLGPREVDSIAPTTGIPFHHYRNRVISNSGGVLAFEDGRVEDINKFVLARIIQVMVDDPGNNNRWMSFFDNEYSTADFAQLIKPGDIVAMNWEKGTPIEVLLFCNSR